MTTEEKLKAVKEIIAEQVCLEFKLREVLECDCDGYVDEEMEVEEVEEGQDEDGEKEPPEKESGYIGRGRRPGNKLCSVPECTRKHAAKGFCSSHYAQSKRVEESAGEVEYEEVTKRAFVPRPVMEVQDGKKANMYCDEEECMNQFVGTLPLSDNTCPACGSDTILLSKFQDDL